MGAYLSTPCRIIDEEYGSGNGMEFGVGEMQGWRRQMEDAHIAVPDISKMLQEQGNSKTTEEHMHSLFAVFDGHGGKEVARFCKDYFVGELIKTPQFNDGNYVAALRETFHIMDTMIDDIKHDELLKQYRNIQNPSDRAANDQSKTKDKDVPTSVDGLIDQPVSAKKIQYSRAMELFMELLKQESDAKALSMGLKSSEQKSSDDMVLEEKSLAPFEDADDDDSDTNNLAEGAVVASNPDDIVPMEVENEEFQLDLEVHGATVADTIYKYESMGRMCMLKDHRICAGCTAVVALRVDNTLMVANAGDSRAVLCRSGQAIQLSLDHKPSQIREYERIKKAGGFVSAVGRVNGNLNLSRAIGDLKYKSVPGVHRKNQIISAEPDVTVTNLIPDQDEFFLLACDGVWDCLSSQEAVDFVRTRLKEGMPLSQIIKECLEFCLAEEPGRNQGIGSDNMTFLIVKLKDVI